MNFLISGQNLMDLRLTPRILHRLEKVLLAGERDVENHRVLKAAGLEDEMCENDSQTESGTESMGGDVYDSSEHEDE